MAAKEKEKESPVNAAQVECCPLLEKCDACDVLDFRYRLPFRPLVGAGDRRQVVRVEVTLRFRLERCPGPLALGDILYSTTLLPGEKVRLFTSDRHSRFTFDTESKLAYRHETTSEESFFMAGMANSMSDLSIIENASKTSTFSESSVGGGGSAGVSLFGLINLGGSVSASSYDAQSASTLARTLTQHAESSSAHVEVGTRAASSTSVGEVQSRTHTQGESDDHFESASRVFKNPNRCHAVTFFFYKINKCQTVRFILIGIDRRIEDPASPTGVTMNPPIRTGGVSVIPNAVLASSKDRLDVERRARTSVSESQVTAQVALAQFGAFQVAQPVAADVRKAALEEVDKELVAEGLLDKVGGDVSPKAQQRFSWERTVLLPTPGVLVKGCLDECDICEPSLDKEIELDLQRKQLENDLLKKQIDLLEQSQEYRCCPEGSTETPAPTP